MQEDIKTKNSDFMKNHLKVHFRRTWANISVLSWRFFMAELRPWSSAKRLGLTITFSLMETFWKQQQSGTLVSLLVSTYRTANLLKPANMPGWSTLKLLPLRKLVQKGHKTEIRSGERVNKKRFIIIIRPRCVRFFKIQYYWQRLEYICSTATIFWTCVDAKAGVKWQFSRMAVSMVYAKWYMGIYSEVPTTRFDLSQWRYILLYMH